MQPLLGKRPKIVLIFPLYFLFEVYWLHHRFVKISFVFASERKIIEEIQKGRPYKKIVVHRLIYVVKSMHLKINTYM